MVTSPSKEADGRLNSHELYMYNVIVDKIERKIDCTKDDIELSLPYAEEATKNIIFKTERAYEDAGWKTAKLFKARLKSGGVTSLHVRLSNRPLKEVEEAFWRGHDRY
ncbi:MAG: hypothetical protein HQ538_01835 [Parcubacteria group bacterium]|nr:hypothetical protein [Parcubacteria group bacterium]